MNTGERVGEREQMLRQRDRRAKNNIVFIIGFGSLDILRRFRCTYVLKLIGNYDS